MSNFSFLRGASHPEELVEQAAALGYRALAITDECSVAGVVRAWQRCRQQNIELQLIVGSEFYTEGLHLVVLASSRLGYSQLCRLITRCRRRASKGEYELETSDLSHDDLTDCLLIWHPTGTLATDSAQADCLKAGAPGRLWVGISNHLTHDSVNVMRYRQSLAAQLNLPLVAANQVH
ncbi:MAG: PHP domain-containing protein, partial [Natronospirillum sp.]